MNKLLYIYIGIESAEFIFTNGIEMYSFWIESNGRIYYYSTDMRIYTTEHNFTLIYEAN